MLHIIVIHGLGMTGYEQFAAKVEAQIVEALKNHLGQEVVGDVRIRPGSAVVRSVNGGYEPYIEIQTTHDHDEIADLIKAAVYDYGLAVAVVGLARFDERKGGGSKFASFAFDAERVLSVDR